MIIGFGVKCKYKLPRRELRSFGIRKFFEIEKPALPLLVLSPAIKLV
jgi:hypothetical protein